MQFYEMRFPFDSKDFVKKNMQLGPTFYHLPLEDYWANCADDYDMRRRI